MSFGLNKNTLQWISHGLGGKFSPLKANIWPNPPRFLAETLLAPTTPSHLPRPLEEPNLLQSFRSLFPAPSFLSLFQPPPGQRSTFTFKTPKSRRTTGTGSDLLIEGSRVSSLR